MSNVVLLDPDPTRRPALAAAIAVEHRILASADPVETARLIDRGADILLADADCFPEALILDLIRRGRGRLGVILAGSPRPSYAGDRTVFLDKPIRIDQISLAIRALSAFVGREPGKVPNHVPGTYGGFAPFPSSSDPTSGDGLDGPSPAIARVREEIERYSTYEFPVVITGETGTGKELAAKRLHGRSRRSGKPFVAVNCAALGDELAASELFGTQRGAFTGAVDRRGALETAADGTLFLDELGDMRQPVQALLLRALEERETVRLGGGKPQPFAARVLAATHVDLAGEDFRADLLARLEILTLEMPPLRERLEDIPWLCERFLRAEGAASKLSGSALDRLLSHSWPGNVRELRNVILRALVAAGPGEPIEADHVAFRSLGRKGRGSRDYGERP